MDDKWEKIGVVGVDSGQLMITDPCYIDGQWKHEEFVDHRAYGDRNGLRFVFGVDFTNYQEKLEALGGRTPNDAIHSGEWERLDDEMYTQAGLYSYRGVCDTTLREPRAGQINYAMGHPGVAVAFASGYGDGSYPVYARRNDEGRIVEVRIVMDAYDYGDVAGDE